MLFMLAPFMTATTSCRRKPFVTMKPTFVLLLPAMPIRMGLQRFSRFEPLLTHTTLVRPMLILMDMFDVHIQPMFLEFFAADGTLGRRTRMDFVVVIQFCFGLKRHAAC